MKNSYFYKVVVEQKNLPGKKIILMFLRVLSCIYSGVVKLRLFLYKTGILKTYHLNVPVISIGNISVGGSGKTVFTHTIANLVKNEFGRKPAVLLRGYGAKVESSNDKNIKIDEEMVLTRNLNDVPVLVRKDRVNSGIKAIKEFKANCIILDDGFQYLELKKDLSLVLIKPHTVIEPQFPLPRGLLREPFSHLDRADVVVVTDIDRVSEDKVELIHTYLHNICPSSLILFASYTPSHLYNVTKKKTANFGKLVNRKFIAFSGIGDPGSFRNSLIKQKFRLEEEIVYPDHYNYEDEDINHILKKVKKLGITNVITTQKDIYKINPYVDEFIDQNINLYFMKVKLELTKEEYRRKLYDKLYNLFNG